MAVNCHLPKTHRELLIPFGPQWGPHRARKKLRPEKNGHMIRDKIYGANTRVQNYDTQCGKLITNTSKYGLLF